jgi:hypothetical protein
MLEAQEKEGVTEKALGRKEKKRVSFQPTAGYATGKRLTPGQKLILFSALYPGSSPPTIRLSSVPAENRVFVSAWLMMARVLRSTVDG